ncbi:MAG: SAM-dependent methyltransferase [Polyangiaceae bacterium]
MRLASVSTASTPRRPVGWAPPGPRPRGAAGDATLVPGDDEDLSYLTGDYRIFQLKRGHRWSLDDFATAWIALRAVRGAAMDVAQFADLGCGIGSVLMMLAWGLPHARGFGVEAQAVSHGLALRSLRFNGADERCSIALGDLREPSALPPARSCDLVTGTPPYIPVGSGLVSEKAQRGPCCFETRGGIEDYAAAAAPLLTPTGLFVACVGAWPDGRGEAAAASAGLRVERRVDVIPRAGKPTLFRVLVMGCADGPPRAMPSMPRLVPSARPEQDDVGAIESFTVRDEFGALTFEMHVARADMGLPPRPAVMQEDPR